MRTSQIQPYAREIFTVMTATIHLLNIEQIGPIVQFHRKKAGLSRVDLAMVAGIGKTAIYDIEHGKPTVKFNTLFKVLSKTGTGHGKHLL